MFVKITHYIRPHGRTLETVVKITEDLSEDIKSMEEHGCNLALETLPMGLLALTIENKDEEQDVDIRTVHCNGKEVAITALLKARRWEKK